MDALFSSVCGNNGDACNVIGIWVAALLTLCVFSFLIRDTFLFRLASNLLVGTAAGYAGAVIIRTVLWDNLLAPLLSDMGNLFANEWLLLIPLALGASLLLKLVPNWRATTFSNFGLGYLFGVGAALAISGALSGALAPQLSATVVSLAPNGDVFNSLNNLLIVVGTLGALLAFRFVNVNGTPLLRAYGQVASTWGIIGRAFIMVAFGAIFAGVLAARVSALVGQLYFLLHDWLAIIK